jgi:SagB-type dehydrogenase family enzyme
MSETIDLPPPDTLGGPSLTLTIGQRRSVRAFAARELDRSAIGQLLWAAQGITDPASGLRTAPSAGALYPLEIDVATRGGLSRYRPARHVLERRVARDVRAELAHAALEQTFIAAAPCVFAIAAVAERTTRKYESRGVRYIHMEAGHAAQTLLLQAQALGLAGVPVGAFDDEAVARALHSARDEEPLYLLPVGWPA